MTTTQDVKSGSSQQLRMLAAIVFLVLYAAQLVLIINSGGLNLWQLPLILLAIYVADVLSGILHFFLDYRRTKPKSGLRELYFYKGDKNSSEYLIQKQSVMKHVSPLEKIVFDFKVHHLSPSALGRRSFLHLLLPSIYAFGLPSVVVMLTLQGMSWLPPLVGMFIWVVTGALILSQYAHSCAHKRQVPKVALYLQKMGLFMTAKQHRSHHADLGVDFCIINGWGNAVVNRIFRFCRHRGWIFDEGLTPR